MEVGRDITLDQLRERHDAVVVSAGCMYPVAMNIPGEELDGVIYGVDFLKRANLGEEQWVGEHAVIVGGGYTAMDCSRTSLRHGAANVAIVDGLKRVGERAHIRLWINRARQTMPGEAPHRLRGPA